MKKIRQGIFETNSSSTHSISIRQLGPDDMMDTSIIPDENGVAHIIGETEFGWEPEVYIDAGTKAIYCYLDTDENTSYRDMLIKVIKDQTGADSVVFHVSDWLLGLSSDNNCFPEGYIDHQSSGTSYDAFDSLETLRNFIFNPNSELYTDNDNH